MQIVLQKSPSGLCEIEICNNRIGVRASLNRCCVFAPDFESGLRTPGELSSLVGRRVSMRHLTVESAIKQIIYGLAAVPGEKLPCGSRSKMCSLLKWLSILLMAGQLRGPILRDDEAYKLGLWNSFSKG